MASEGQAGPVPGPAGSRAGDDRYRLLVDHIADVVIHAGGDGAILYVSPAIRRYGYEPEELLGRQGDSLAHPDDLERLRGLIDDLIAERAPPVGPKRDWRLVTKDGGAVWVEGRSMLVRDGQGRPIEMISTLREVAARRQARIDMTRLASRYQLLADRSTDIILRYDAEGRIEFASPASRHLGHAPEAVVGRTIGDLTHPDDRDEIWRRHRSIIAGDGGDAEGLHEIRVQHAEGHWVWLEGARAPITDDDGAVIGVVSTLRNINKRKQVQAALAESEARYRVLAENATDIILRYDTQGIVEFASPAVRHMGYEPGEVVGRQMDDFIHPDDRVGMRQLREAMMADDPIAVGHQAEGRALSASGQWFWLESNPSPVRDASGRIIGAITALRDVTARKRIEEALAESEARYRLLADKSTDLIVRYDINGVVEFASPAVRRYGFEPADVVGRRLIDFVHPDDRAEAQQRLVNLLTGGADADGVPGESRTRTASGDWVWLESNPSPILDAEGRIVGAVSVFRDVTERRAMEDELRRKQAEAEAAAEAKTEFLANMSHEIRTPLTGIIGFAGLMEKLDGLPPAAAQYASRIATASQTLLAVVNDVLDFSKIEAGQIQLDPQPFDPAGFVAETLELVAGQAAARGLALRGDVVGPLPAAVDADSARMRQVLLNLIGNAIKFTHRGEVRVEVGYDAGAGQLRIAVTDTGVGIAPDALDRLFQRFSQVDGSISRRFGGTGLGLAISKSLAELMGGAIGVESQEGRGSTFWFTVAAPPAVLPEAAQPSEEADWSGQAARILIVDDVAVNRELVRVMLSAFGHALDEAANGAQAVEAAMRRAYDLILMDLQMPGMDGLAATRAIRGTCDLNRATPIVALSADVMPEHLERCREAGMNDHIAKPISPAELLHKVGLWTAASADADGEPA